MNLLLWVKFRTHCIYTPHHRAVITTFLISFANFSTIGMIIGTLKGIVDKKTSDFVSKYVPMMLLSGILVSLLTAAFVGLFAWKDVEE